MIERIRAQEPDAAFRSSFIVGFPGEDETRARRAARVPRRRAARLGRVLPVLARGRHAGGVAARTRSPDDLVAEWLRECEDVQEPITRGARDALVGRRGRGARRRASTTSPACSSAAPTARRPRSTASCTSTPSGRAPVRSCARTSPRPLGPDLVAKGRHGRRRERARHERARPVAPRYGRQRPTRSPRRRTSSRSRGWCSRCPRCCSSSTRARPGSPFAVVRARVPPTGSTAGSPAATAPPARARSSIRSPTSSSCSAGSSRSGISGDFSWAAVIIVAVREVGDLDLPVVRRPARHLAAGAASSGKWKAFFQFLAVGSCCSRRPTSGRRSTTSSCGSRSRSRWSRARHPAPRLGRSSRTQRGGRCGVTSSRSAPSCCSARSSTRTARGSASSSPRPASTRASTARSATTSAAWSSACASCSTAPTPSSCAAASAPRPTTSPARRSPR